MAEHARHPIFARVYTKVAEIGERRGGAEHRRKLLAGLTGRVMEIGAGSGANFSTIQPRSAKSSPSSPSSIYANARNAQR